MNKIIIAILMCMSMQLKAENVIQVIPFTTIQGMTSDDMKSFDIEMTNEEDVWGVQFDLYLPEGMTLDFSDDYPPFDEISSGSYERYPYTTGRGGAKTYKHGVDWNKLNDVPGHYWFAITPNDESFITETSGTILTLYYLTSSDMESGVYPIVIRGTVISGRTTDVRPIDAVSYVKIGTPATNTVYNLGGTTAEQLLVPSFVQTALNAENNVVVNETCRNLVLADGADYVAASAFTAANASYSAEVTSALGYKTVVLPYASAVPAGFEAYEVSSITGNTLNLASVSTITADKPVLLKNAGTASLSAADVAVSASTGSLTDGELVGTYSEIDAPVGSYVLQNQGGNVAFYNVQSTQPKVPAFRAYIKSQASGARVMNIVTDGQATGIMNVESGEMMDMKSIHTVDGVRRSALGNGINIVRTENGVKKVIINN